MAFTDRLKTYHRKRELAGAARAGSWSRAKTRAEHRAFVRKNSVLFTVFLSVGAAVMLAVAWMMPNSFTSGVVLGASLVAVPGALWITTVQVSGTAPRMMGEDAEQWTSDPLRRLARLGWQLVNHVTLAGSDVDHVLIGPGGAFAVETKWSSSWEGEYGSQRLGIAVAQARDGARRLGLWHPFKSLGIAPMPVVVLWGGGLSTTTPIRVIDGVTVIYGKALKEWTSTLGQGRLTHDEIADAWSALDHHVARRDLADSMERPMPTSFAEVVARMVLAIAAGASALVAFAGILGRTRSVFGTVLLAALLLSPSYFLRRSSTLKWAAYAWSAGLSLLSVAVLLDVAIS